MRNVHARHKLYTNTMRVKEVVKLTAPTCIGLRLRRRKSKANRNINRWVPTTLYVKKWLPVHY